MFDVVPPQPNTPPLRGRRPRRLARAAQPKTKLTAPGPAVVAPDWRLPARLRRPIRQELDRQRRKARVRRAIVQFERRPIYSSLPNTHPSYTGKAPRNTGAEHHTGDVYKYSQPGTSLVIPPYQGKHKQQPAINRPTPKPVRQTATTALPKKIPRIQTPVLRVPPLPTKLVIPKQVPVIAPERDVPYTWPQAKAVAPVKPKKRFTLPLHFSILPLNLLPKRAEGLHVPPKKKLVNLGILLAACGLAWGGFTVFQDAGRGYAVLGSVTAQAHQAYDHVAAAQVALAATKFDVSEQEFSEANQLLQEAHGQLSQALAASETILKTIDVTGKVRSGDQLLVAGETLTTAGEHISRGLAPLLKAKLFVNGDKPPEFTMVQAIAAATEEFTQASASLTQAEKALAQVKVETVPADIQEPVRTLQATVPKAHQAIDLFLHQSQALLTVLGADRGRQYLVLFENNNEQRATGGFIGSLALLNVDKGLVEHIDVQSVYDPDGQLKDYISPPEPLRRITNRWYLRDANWFVDFKISAEKIANFFEKENGPTVDGVIALTPEVIKSLLQVTGPIKVPGYDVTVDTNNFVLLTQDQVTYNYDKSANKPKQFLADLTPILLNKLFSAPAGNSLQVLSALGTALSEKQLLMYFKDPELQTRIHEVGWDGSYPPDAPGFLSVNNSNIGGHKSDQFITQEIDYRTDVGSDGVAEATVTIRRTHNGPTEALEYKYPVGEDPSKKDNVVYQRVLVPKGATLLEAHGYTPATEIKSLVEPDTSLPVVPDPDVAEWQRVQTVDSSGTAIGQEAGYTTFANWIVTPPGQTTVTVYRYRLPMSVSQPGFFDQAKQYQMYVAKQPGDTRTMVRISLQLPESAKIVHTVPDTGITYEGDNIAVYRGALQHDVVMGAVFAKK